MPYPIPYRNSAYQPKLRGHGKLVFLIKNDIMEAYMYILKCADGSYYTGSTKNLERRIHQHKSGAGSQHTRSRLPVILVYIEYYPRIEDAFRREKQIQRWSAAKKVALIKRDMPRLKELAACKNKTHYLNNPNLLLK